MNKLLNVSFDVDFKSTRLSSGNGNLGRCSGSIYTPAYTQCKVSAHYNQRSQLSRPGMQRALNPDSKDLNLELAKMLLQYRRIPHCVTKVSPAELMFSRNVRCRLDLLKPKTVVPKTNAEVTGKVRNFVVDQRVAVRDYVHQYKWVFGRVSERLGKLHYLVRLDDDRMWKRHVDQIREIGENTPKQSYLEVTLPLPSKSGPPPNVETPLRSPLINRDTENPVSNKDTQIDNDKSDDKSDANVDIEQRNEPQSSHASPVLRRSTRERKAVERLTYN